MPVVVVLASVLIVSSSPKMLMSLRGILGLFSRSISTVVSSWFDQPLSSMAVSMVWMLSSLSTVATKSCRYSMTHSVQLAIYRKEIANYKY